MAWEETYEDERRDLLERIGAIKSAHQSAYWAAVEPFAKRLAEIEELRPKVIYVPLASLSEDVLARLGIDPE